MSKPGQGIMPRSAAPSTGVNQEGRRRWRGRTRGGDLRVKHSASPSMHKSKALYGPKKGTTLSGSASKTRLFCSWFVSEELIAHCKREHLSASLSGSHRSLTHQYARRQTTQSVRRECVVVRRMAMHIGEACKHSRVRPRAEAGSRVLDPRSRVVPRHLRRSGAEVCEVVKGQLRAAMTEAGSLSHDQASGERVL